MKVFHDAKKKTKKQDTFSKYRQGCLWPTVSPELENVCSEGVANACTQDTWLPSLIALAECSHQGQRLP